MAISGVILDVDGTLVDSNDAHARAWAEALAKHGRPIPYEQVRSHIGMGGDHLLPAVAGIDRESELGETIAKTRKQLFQERELQGVKAFPEVTRLIERLRKQGLKLAVASSAESSELAPLLERAGVRGLVEHTTSADDAESSKPDPDIVKAALDKLALAPEQVVMLGDTPYDIEAAKRVGVGVVAFRCGGFDDESLRGALFVVDDAVDLLARWDESPFGRTS